MKFNKPPLTISEQILLLKSRGLKFENEVIAQDYLSNISYYRLRAYTYPFQNNQIDSQPFNVELLFEQIIGLYVFDRKLRLLIFDAIEKIEIAFRTQIIYHFSLKYGSHWQLNPQLYRDNVRFSNQIDSLKTEIYRSNETFIDHYLKKYNDPLEPPSWMSLEISSMGLLSKIFQNLKINAEKKTITKHFGLNDVLILENWMLCFSTLRNICAHHGRIWNRRLTPIKIPNNPVYTFLQNKNIHNNKLYATISSIEYILKIISPYSTMGNRLKVLMKDCPLAHNKEMGFPENWENETIWK